MDAIFKLSGALVDEDGEGIKGLLLAVVDEDDFDEDDLIGVGMTQDGGRFTVTFLTSEFQQDTLEMETTPDIKLVASAKIGDTYKAIWHTSFPDLDWSWDGGEVDLGKINVTGYDPDDPTPLEGVEALPGSDRRVERLDITDEMVRHCIAEVAPIVERLTGWPDLTEGLNVDVTDGTSAYVLRDKLKASGVDPDSFTASVYAYIADNTFAPGMGVALYDPGTHTIVINADVMNHTGFDTLKAIVGHELVHVGQYKYTPGLKAYQDHLNAQVPDIDAEVDLDEELAKFAFFTEIEGYASYIEHDFLRAQYYPLGGHGYHASFAESVIHKLVSSLTAPGDDNAKANEAKANQYTEGLERYRARQLGDHPARFDLDVAALPGGAQFVP